MPRSLPPLFVGLVLTLAGPAGAGRIDVLVPAYANPCCGGGPRMWASLIDSARDPGRNFGLHAVLNPASGPGLARDPNYLDAAGAGPLADFRAAGGLAHGYVATGFGDRDAAAVKADVDAYLSGHYAGFVDGIFFDEMSVDLADAGFYQDLNRYVRDRAPDFRTFGNPGTSFTENPSGQTAFTRADHFAAFDATVTFENDAAAYGDGFRSASDLAGSDPARIAHMVHGRAVWDPALLPLAADRGAGFLYVTDDSFAADENPYDALPTYWDTFTADLSAFNPAAAPER